MIPPTGSTWPRRVTSPVIATSSRVEIPVSKEISAVVNARHLSEVPERNLQRLADMLEEAASRYLSVAASADLSVQIATPNGLVIGPSTMTCLLLGEQLVHGLDIARAANLPWTIGRSDALLVRAAL